jgi:hypothetical protein
VYLGEGMPASTKYPPPYFGHNIAAMVAEVRTLGFIDYSQMQASRPIPTLPG